MCKRKWHRISRFFIWQAKKYVTHYGTQRHTTRKYIQNFFWNNVSSRLDCCHYVPHFEHRQFIRDIKVRINPSTIFPKLLANYAISLKLTVMNHFLPTLITPHSPAPSYYCPTNSAMHALFTILAPRVGETHGICSAQKRLLLAILST